MITMTMTIMMTTSGEGRVARGDRERVNSSPTSCPGADEFTCPRLGSPFISRLVRGTGVVRGHMALIRDYPEGVGASLACAPGPRAARATCNFRTMRPIRSRPIVCGDNATTMASADSLPANFALKYL
jgi:hypothetical protein